MSHTFRAGWAESSPAAFAILVGGSIAGALDIAYAISFSVLRGGSATGLLQTVASGLLGASSYDGGTATAALGLALHFLLALLFAAAFFLSARRVPVLVRRAVPFGVLYGLVVFAIMKFIVLPLSAFPHPIRFSLLATGTDLLSHMFFVGLPIALATRAALSRLTPGRP